MKHPKQFLHDSISAAIAVILFGASCAGVARAQGPPPTLVETAPIVNLSFHDQVKLIGRTEAKSQSSVVAEVSGKVKSIDAGEGDVVKKGARLVTIDSRRIRLLYQAKKAEAAEAKAQAELAAKNLKRAEELFAKHTIAQSKLDTETANATGAQQRYERLRAEERRLELDLDNCIITAPFAGYTGKRLVDIGEWVGAGTPVFEMVDLSAVKVTVDLPERYFGQVAIGSPVTISISAATQANSENAPLVGKVTGVAPSAVEETHTFPVFVTITEPGGRLGAGMLVRATLNLNNEFSSLAISKDAIIRQGAKTMVYTIADGKAAPIPVQTGSTNGSMIAITGPGLREGTPIVVLGNERIYPGASVRTPGQKPDAQQTKKNDAGSDAVKTAENKRTDG